MSVSTIRTVIASSLSVFVLSGVSPAQWAGEWQLDETTGIRAADASGNANDGTLINFSAAASPWVVGKFGNALAFDGVDDYVEVKASATLPVFDGSGSPYSIAYWIKAPRQHVTRVYAEGNSAGGTNTGALFTFGSGDAPNNDDKFQFLLRNDAKNNKCRVYSNAVVYDDTWHHVAFVDVAGVITLYVDGVVDANLTYITGNEPGTPTWGTFTFDRVAIGALQRATPGNFLTGQLDDVRVYNFALSAADVSLMILGVPKQTCSASVGYYGHGCAGNLDIAATGSASYGANLSFHLSGGTPNANALLFVGAGLNPTDLSLAGFTGCFAYPEFTGSILAAVGTLDASGALSPITVSVPSQTALGCAIGVIQGVAISGSRLELSRAVLAQLGK